MNVCILVIKSHPDIKEIFHCSNKHLSPLRRQIEVLGLCQEVGEMFSFIPSCVGLKER